MALATIRIDLIETGQRLRKVSEAQVDSLVASIADVGLLNPITVYPRRIMQSGHFLDGYGVVAGAHRLEACKRLGLVEIDAHVVALSELERQIAECDENLCATTLTKSERALFTKRRKQAYEALHPETKHGGDRASRQVGDLKEADRFTADTAAKTGQSERAVQRDAERGEKVIPEVLEMIKGTRLDTGAFLDKIKRLPPNDQVTATKREMAIERKRLREAPDPETWLKGRDPAAFNKAMHFTAMLEDYARELGKADLATIIPNLDERQAARVRKAIEQSNRYELREAVAEAARIGIRGGDGSRTKPSRNPLYEAPSDAGAAWSHVYGTCRAFAEWATDENMRLAIDGLRERKDDQLRNIEAVRRAIAAFTKFETMLPPHPENPPH